MCTPKLIRVMPVVAKKYISQLLYHIFILLVLLGMPTDKKCWVVRYLFSNLWLAELNLRQGQRTHLYLGAEKRLVLKANALHGRLRVSKISPVDNLHILNSTENVAVVEGSWPLVVSPGLRDIWLYHSNLHSLQFFLSCRCSPSIASKILSGFLLKVNIKWTLSNTVFFRLTDSWNLWPWLTTTPTITAAIYSINKHLQNCLRSVKDDTNLINEFVDLYFISNLKGRR